MFWKNKRPSPVWNALKEAKNKSWTLKQLKSNSDFIILIYTANLRDTQIYK